MRSIITRLMFFSLSLLCVAAFAEETAITVRSVDLKEKPFSDAKTVATLPEKSKVQVKAREASWSQITADNVTGWVKMLSLRMDSGEEAKASSGGFGALIKAATVGNSTSKSTTGVKALSKEELKNASPNPAALATVASFKSDKSTAQKFAKSGDLSAQKVDYIASNGGAK